MHLFIQILIIIEIHHNLFQLGEDIFLKKAFKVFTLLWEPFPEIQSVDIYPFGILFVFP